ncbi:hypothetical protein QMK33_13765 [Hymenobacter sp. H14-R3]|uniref:hypothetical protein n=1 Tax=Hymenobacter sp. H14-R3 TaxID=3046308 RepID=UPI0024B94A27|nr:hypothetical protein [Hymenobacter sp. H14-R3]MDJ0366221.1 hypothetical protein [Hymenobacter sp. H14-R3]
MLTYLLVGLLLATTPAQIAPTTPAQQRAAERQAQRDARRVVAPYKDSHLDPASLGSAAARPHPAREPRFGRDGTPRVSQKKFPGLRRRAAREPKASLRG